MRRSIDERSGAEQRGRYRLAGPVEILNEGGRSAIVLLCEHASRFIPRSMRGLGLGEADLARHIAWDIGAGAVTRALSALLDAPPSSAAIRAC